MTTKLNQKQLVDLFNTEMAPFQKAMDDAQSKYEDALTGFAIKHLGMTADEWKERVEDENQDLSAVEGAMDRKKENYKYSIPVHYWAQEYALTHVIANIEGSDDGCDWADLNVSV